MPVKGTLYIPRTIKLPGPFHVKVCQIIPTKMKEKHGQYYDGIWDVETMTLDINVRLNHKRKWWVYSHEVIHIVNYWIQFLVSNGTAQG